MRDGGFAKRTQPLPFILLTRCSRPGPHPSPHAPAWRWRAVRRVVARERGRWPPAGRRPRTTRKPAHLDDFVTYLNTTIVNTLKVGNQNGDRFDSLAYQRAVQRVNEFGRLAYCKRYDDGQQPADIKVSHRPQDSAILESNFKRAEEKTGVFCGTSRRNSHLGLDPGQKSACSCPALWALTSHRGQAACRGASSQRPEVSAPDSQEHTGP